MTETTQETCTWSVEKETEDGELLKAPCGNHATLVFTRLVKIRGRLPRAERYPRCKKHASKRTIEYAELHGYTVKPLTEEA